MKYLSTDNYERMWHDEIHCVYWNPKSNNHNYYLSKKKILKYFSELSLINPMHMLILDNLSNINAFFYYVDEKKLVVNLNQNFKKLQIDIKSDIITDIIQNCTI